MRCEALLRWKLASQRAKPRDKGNRAGRPQLCAPRLCVLTLKRRASRGVAEAAAEPRGEPPSGRPAARCGQSLARRRASSERGAQYRPGQLPFSRCSFHRSTCGEEREQDASARHASDNAVPAPSRAARQPARHAGAHGASQTQAVPLHTAAWQAAARAASQQRSSGVRWGGNAPTRWGRWSGRRRHTSGTPGPRRPSPWRTWAAARRSARQRRVPAGRLSPALGLAAPAQRARTCGTRCSACSSSWPGSPSGSARRTATSSPAQAVNRVRTERRCEPGAPAPRLDVALLLLRLLRRGSGGRRQPLAAQATGRRAQARLRSSVLGLALPGRCTHRLRLRLRRRSLLLSSGRLLGRHLLLRLLALSAAQQPPHGDFPRLQSEAGQQRDAAAAGGTRSTRRSARTASCPDGALILALCPSILLS